VLLGCAIILIEYFVLARGFKATTWQRVCFTLGTLLLALALVSPLDIIGDIYLFSAHMTQHLILLLLVPPLWLFGLPPKLLKRLRGNSWFSKGERVLSQPVLAWFIGIATVWVWHLPVLFEATLENEIIHIGEHLLFIASGLIFWWPIIVKPAPTVKALSPLLAIVYLFLGAVGSSFLGIILTFSPAGIYPEYLHPGDLYGVLPTIRQNWGISAALDQQVGGILMWVVGTPVYVLGCLAELANWYKQAELETNREIAAQLEAERSQNAGLLLSAKGDTK
jgi:putative membrane protein